MTTKIFFLFRTASFWCFKDRLTLPGIASRVYFNWFNVHFRIGIKIVIICKIQAELTMRITAVKCQFFNDWKMGSTLKILMDNKSISFDEKGSPWHES